MARPWKLTQRRRRTPIAAILSSAGAAVGAGPVGPHDPDADAPLAPLAADAELGQRRDHPFLEPVDEPPHVAAARAHVEHDVDDALAGPVVGVLPPPPRRVDGKAGRVAQVLGRALVPAV